MKKYFLPILLFAAGGAYAIPCPTPTQHPEGAEVYPTCGAHGVFLKDGKYGFFDTHSGETLAEAQFDEVKDRYVAPDLTPVRQGEKWAYVDGKGQAQTPYQYEYAEHFHSGPLAIVGKDGRYGMIDTQMRIAVPLEYTRLDGFMLPEVPDYPAYLTVACKDGKCGFLNQKGETAIPLHYEDAGGFGAGVAPVKKGDKWGYIHPQGEVVQDFVYNEAPAFHKPWYGQRNVSCVEATRDGKRVAIGPQGEILPEDTICLLLPPPMI